VSSLNIEDFNEADSTLKIKGKGKLNKEAIYLSSKTCEAIKQWLAVRYKPNPSQPLFIALDRAFNGHRLSTKSIYCLTKKHSESVKELSPHKIRHSAITAVLDASNGNVRLAQKFSRHKNLDVLCKYDDNRIELQKEAVNLLATLA
jgi:integrase/recombinase XerC